MTDEAPKRPDDPNAPQPLPDRPKRRAKSTRVELIIAIAAGLLISYVSIFHPRWFP